MILYCRNPFSLKELYGFVCFHLLTAKYATTYVILIFKSSGSFNNPNA